MESQLPSPSYVWGVLPIRFEIELTRHKSEICRGLYEEYGSDDGNFNAEREECEIIDELTKVLVQAVAEDTEVRQISNNDGPRAGRPGEAMIPYLAHALLSVYLRYHNSGGPKVGGDFRRWQAQARRSRPIARVHQGSNRTIEPLFDERPVS